METQKQHVVATEEQRGDEAEIVSLTPSEMAQAAGGLLGVCFA